METEMSTKQSLYILTFSETKKIERLSHLIALLLASLQLN